MKKIFAVSLTIFLLSLFVFPKLSLAVTLTTTELQATSVVLNAEGLLPNKHYVVFYVTNFNSQTPSYTYSPETTINNDGTASSPVGGLSAGGKYSVTLSYKNDPQILASIDFTTPTPNSEKEITQFDFLDLALAVRGQIDQNAHTITLSVPNGTDATNLVPTIQFSGKIISPPPPDPNNPVGEDFSNPVTYTVTAEDNSTQEYTVAVFVLNNIITNGACGPANGETSPTAPTSELCSSGIPTAVSGSGPWTWKCNGAGGGTDISCSAEKGDSNKKKTDLSTSGLGLTAPCPEDGCGFNELMIVINKIINFIIFVMAIPIAAIMFAYAGFMLVTSGGASEQRTKAKGIFISVAIGLVIAAACWLIVHTLLSIVGYDGSWIGL